MSYSSEDETDISDSELDDYVDQCYEQLQSGNVKVKYSDELYRCPYCPGKKKLVYPYKDLFQHASDVGKGSMNKEIKHKGKHLGLVKYLKSLLDSEDLSSEMAGLAIGLPTDNSVNEFFVWPWMGILANVDGKDLSVSRLRGDLSKKGFNPVRLRPLWNDAANPVSVQPLSNDADKSKYAIVEFKRDWSGFYNAMMFERSFEADHHGKRDHGAASHVGGGLYGWVARDDDFNSKGVVGEYLQRNGDLKTVADVEAEEKRKTVILVSNLTNTIEELRVCLDGTDDKISEAPAAIG